MARYSMPGFPLGLAGHVTMTKSHGFLVYISYGYTSHFALGLLAFSHREAFSYV